jgi:hypothetical protein
MPGATQQPPRAVILKRTAQNLLARRRQRRSNRVTGVGEVGLARERKWEGGGTVNHLTRLEGEAL